MVQERTSYESGRRAQSGPSNYFRYCENDLTTTAVDNRKHNPTRFAQTDARKTNNKKSYWSYIKTRGTSGKNTEINPLMEFGILKIMDFPSVENSLKTVLCDIDRL